MQRGTLVLLTVSTAALAILACRDITGLRPPDASLRFLNPAGPVVVSPGNMHGWAFYDDQQGVACGDTLNCRLVTGPATPPAGSGSAELAVTAASQGNALILQDYASTRFTDITELRYSTYRQSADAGNNLAIALQVNADYDLSDQAAGYQGRLVFEPYQGNGGAVVQNAWQSWDARAGKWWGTRASVSKGGVSVTNPCVQATPCSWAELLAAFPNLGVHATYGAVVLKAGSGWASFRGNVDQLAIGVSGTTTTFDFELAPLDISAPPDSVPSALISALGSVSGPPLPHGEYVRDLVIVDFLPGTPAAARQAAIDSVGGVVVGGSRYQETPADGSYYIRVVGGTASSLLRAITTLQHLPQVSAASWWPLTLDDQILYRLPVDSAGAWRSWRVDPVTPNAARPNWGLEYVRAPMAWGCEPGSGATRVAVVDAGVYITANIRRNFDLASSAVIDSNDAALDHATRVASVLGAVGNDSAGMTGMIWKTRMTVRERFASLKHPGKRIFYEEEPPNRNLTNHLVAAGMVSGVKVINVSLGNNFHGNYHPHPYNPNDSSDAAAVKEMKATVTTAIERLLAKGKQPLFVIAAGNDGVDAEAAGTAAAKADFPNQVLVVGALGTDGAIWSRSNRGSLVDVYAPGVAVTQADRADQLVNSEPGTSFAAPLASGVATLLNDFDPSLTAADLVSLIKAGARFEDGVYKLDAYGALQQAARRSHAPLCGNRVYKSGNGIYAERAAGPEKIIDLPGQTADSGNANIDVYHGGKRIDLGFSEQYDWRASPRGFTHAATYQYSDTLLDGAAYLSGFGISHDYDLRGFSNGPFQYLMNESVATDSATLTLYGTDGLSTPITIDRFTIARPTTQVAVGRVPVPKPDDHYAGYFTNANWIYVGEWTQPSGDPVIAMAPDGTFALAAVNVFTFGLTANEDFAPCAPPGLYDMPPAECASGTKSWSSVRAELYRIDLTNHTSRHLTSLPGTSIAWMALAENARELVWQTLVSTASNSVLYRFQGNQAPTYGMYYTTILTSSNSCTGKRYEYRAFDPDPQASAPLGNAAIVSEPVDDGCYADHSNLGGTIAPSRIPTSAGGMPMVAPRPTAPPPGVRRALKRSRNSSAIRR